MAVPLLIEPSNICTTTSATITFSFVEYPPEALIDEAMSRPLDRCSRFFEHNEETFHEEGEKPIAGEELPQEGAGESAKDDVEGLVAPDTEDHLLQGGPNPGE